MCKFVINLMILATDTFRYGEKQFLTHDGKMPCRFK